MKVRGIVTGGKRLGRKLGFPTANVTLGSECVAPEGVYAARATVGGQTYGGMANVGRKNSIHGASEDTYVQPGPLVLEINLFEFEGDIYGEDIEIELLERMRGERNFSSVDELKAAVDNDRRTIQEYFKTHR